MKKHFIVAVFFLCIISFVQAQDDIIIGVNGGVNIASINGEDSPAKIVPHFGAFAQFPINETFLIVPELLVSWQGHGKEEFSPGLTSKLNTTYINIPVTFRYNITYNINVFAGPQFGFLASANSVTDLGTGDEKFDVKDQFNTFDLGLMFGGGIAFMDRFQAYIRYILGLSNLDNNGSISRSNGVFQLGVGINLHRVEK